jgi:hypothetical protein
MKTNILRWTIALILGTGLLFISCTDNSTEPSYDTNYSIKVIVKDQAGVPINGLRVSAWDVLSIDLLLNKADGTNQLNRTDNISAASSLNFIIAANSHVLLTAFNFRNQEIDTLVDELLGAGRYQRIWVPPSGSPSSVYKIRLTAANDSINFQDSIYAVYHTQDPEQNVVGWTTHSGVFELSDASLFLNKLDLPEFNRTYSTGPEIIGTFNYTNSVAVILTDTSTHQQQRYFVTIGRQRNTFNLTWNPPNNLLAANRQYVGLAAKTQSIASDTVIVVVPPLFWKLEQNYPNPFN